MPGQSGFHLNPHHSRGGSRHQPGHPSLRSIQDASQVLAPTGRTVLGMCLTCMVIFIGSPTTLEPKGPTSARKRTYGYPVQLANMLRPQGPTSARKRTYGYPMLFSPVYHGKCIMDCSHSRNLVPVQSTGRCTSISEDRARQQLLGTGFSLAKDVIIGQLQGASAAKLHGELA